jgi:hypothetical protein
MRREIAAYRAATAKRYGRGTSHAIQVDFLAYLRQIRRERRAGAWRARQAGHHAQAQSTPSAGRQLRQRKKATATRYDRPPTAHSQS